jgi:hypothetical protein
MCQVPRWLMKSFALAFVSLLRHLSKAGNVKNVRLSFLLTILTFHECINIIILSKSIN